MSPTRDIPRSASKKASAVLEHLAAERRTTLDLAQDAWWIREITPRPAGLLYRMTKNGSLYRITRGRYAVAPRASVMVEQAGAPEAFADLRLSHRTPYYVGFLSALIDHGLTDVQSTKLYIAIPSDNPVRRSRLDVPGKHTVLVTLSERRWPDEQDLTTIRPNRGSAETFTISTVPRTLVDALARPDHSGGVELVAEAWARANRAPATDWRRVAEIGRSYGPDQARRVAFMLTRLGKSAEARLAMGGRRGRSARVLLDRSNSYALPDQARRRDTETGVVINVPEDYLDAWLNPLN